MTGTGPLVSAIVANHNAAPFLAACLHSILDQDLTDLEIVLVDDVSTDDGVAIARAIAARDSRLRIVARSVNGGPAAARNQALGLARGRWIAIVDSDDLLHPRRFSALIAAADAAGADIVADDLLVFTDGSAAPPVRFLKPSDHAAPFRLDLAEYLRRSVLYGREPNPGFLKPLMRRDRLVASGLGYDETLRIAEDDDLVVRLLLAGLTYLVVPTPRYFYRKHGGSISHRLTLSAVTAMQAADRATTRAIVAQRPDLAQACAVRGGAFDRAVAFETLVALLKQRQPARAARVLAATPAILPMLGMPLLGALRKMTARLAPAGPLPRAPAIQHQYLHEIADRAGAAD